MLVEDTKNTKNGKEIKVFNFPKLDDPNYSYFIDHRNYISSTPNKDNDHTCSGHEISPALRQRHRANRKQITESRPDLSNRDIINIADAQTSSTGFVAGEKAHFGIYKDCSYKSIEPEIRLMNLMRI